MSPSIPLGCTRQLLGFSQRDDNQRWLKEQFRHGYIQRRDRQRQRDHQRRGQSDDRQAVWRRVPSPQQKYLS